ncbi:hypothetical protein B5K08_31050 [Rhizobium leguminosarum bv. trifolii]|uniref:Uncharacterized protein n=1 Tax=Rhizobium leguminosarum bv. trifolii TaxID=386 RepID=A0A3E1AYG4_RHILT|nr:hypothetical protein [Rhizobium leguminosarum]RFB82148.1 hypothetical protein B5K10_31045 [Rhizobium leguminosarum bv. trifolii]RFB82653.1 hypothetical protein B5K08_31050 [Rhizobium leguminosarum bv. trifolii]
MPYRVKVHFEKKYTAVTVSDGFNPYVDIHGITLKNLNVGAGAMYEISVGLFNGAGTVIVDATDGAANQFPYAIPVDCDNDGNIKVPKVAAVSQSDLDNLDAQVKNLAKHIAANKSGK